MLDVIHPFLFLGLISARQAKLPKTIIHGHDMFLVKPQAVHPTRRKRERTLKDIRIRPIVGSPLLPRNQYPPSPTE
ncbi:hypothetical protein BM1_05523 [Bipolaris maydis]|nr:hypothetical protein BM1_05523 [Bipolaris maydis]